MDRKLLYIVNPISGKGKGLSLQQVIQNKTAAAGLHSAFYPSVASGDYSYLIPIITEENFTDIIIAGGDGTVNQVVNSLRAQGKPFGIIPCGSGNGLAFTAGIPKNVDRAMQVIFNGKTEPCDAFMVNEHFACMLAGLGFDAQVAQDFANDPKRGLATYIKKTVSHFFSAGNYSFTLSAGEQDIKTEALFISIANSNQFGNHFTIAPKASLKDGLLDIVVMTRQNKFSALLQAFMQVGGLNPLQQPDMINEKAGVLYFQIPKIAIENPDLAPLHIDGDPAPTSKRLKIQVIKNGFRLIQ